MRFDVRAGYSQSQNFRAEPEKLERVTYRSNSAITIIGLSLNRSICHKRLLGLAISSRHTADVNFERFRVLSLMQCIAGVKFPICRLVSVSFSPAASRSTRTERLRQ